MKKVLTEIEGGLARVQDLTTLIKAVCADHPLVPRITLLDVVRDIEVRFTQARKELCEMYDYEKCLEEMERIGWPCRLVELPREYETVCRKLASVLEYVNRAVKLGHNDDNGIEILLRGLKNGWKEGGYYED